MSDLSMWSKFPFLIGKVLTFASYIGSYSPSEQFPFLIDKVLTTGGNFTTLVLIFWVSIPYR